LKGLNIFLNVIRKCNTVIKLKENNRKGGNFKTKKLFTIESFKIVYKSQQLNFQETKIKFIAKIHFFCRYSHHVYEES
jgi:hypothetical protein